MSRFYFTLSSNQGGPGCVEIEAENYGEARNIMNEEWGPRWAFQYESYEEVHPLDQKILARFGEEQ